MVTIRYAHGKANGELFLNAEDLRDLFTEEAMRCNDALQDAMLPEADQQQLIALREGITIALEHITDCERVEA